jgi:hypothetical protein
MQKFEWYCFLICLLSHVETDFNFIVLRAAQSHVLGVEQLLPGCVFLESWQPCQMILFGEVILGLVDLLSSIFIGN